MKNLKLLINEHSKILENNPYCYFELAYTRQTEWMVWLCSKPKEDDPNREVLAYGQGSTVNIAARNALHKLMSKIEV